MRPFLALVWLTVATSFVAARFVTIRAMTVRGTIRGDPGTKLAVGFLPRLSNVNQHLHANFDERLNPLHILFELHPSLVGTSPSLLEFLVGAIYSLFGPLGSGLGVLLTYGDVS
jgi:hypothetical protein